MTCFASVFAEKILKINYEHPQLVQLLNIPLAAELFFASYWQKAFNESVTMPSLKNNEGWDFKTAVHYVEVKSCVGQVTKSNSIRYEIKHLENKLGSYLCTMFDSPCGNYCFIGMGIPPQVWQPLMSNSGRINITTNTSNQHLTQREDSVLFMSYHTLYNKTTLGYLLDTIS